MTEKQLVKKAKADGVEANVTTHLFQSVYRPGGTACNPPPDGLWVAVVEVRKGDTVLAGDALYAEGDTKSFKAALDHAYEAVTAHVS